MSEDSADPGFRRILVVLNDADDRPALIRSAAKRAARSGAALRIAAVVEPPAGLIHFARRAQRDLDQLQSDLIAREQTLLAQALAAADLPADTPQILRVGKVFLEIIREAIAWEADLVIKQASRDAAPLAPIFGSTDQHLLRKCPCPIWLSPAPPHAPERVLAAVDIDLDGAAQPDKLAGLNQAVLNTALRLAHWNSAEVTLLHAWDAPAESLLKTWAGGTDPDAEARAYIDALMSDLWREMDGLLAEGAAWRPPGGGAPPTLVPKMVRRPARHGIVETVADIGADLLVMGTIARTGVPGFIIGNTAEDVLNAVQCPVVTVKPPGYVSPVAEIDA